MPAAHGKRLVVLDHLAELFEPGRRYPSRRSTSCSGATTPTTPCCAATWSTTAWTGPTSEAEVADGQGLLAHRRHRGHLGAYFFLNRSLASAKVAVRASLSDPAAFLVCSPTCGSRTASPRR